MVPNLNDPNAPHSLDSFRSHPHKTLRQHTRGVLVGVERHTQHPIACIAALWHDVGKLNPNFQLKLDDKANGDYDHHAYLSALAFLAYCCDNPKISDLGLQSGADVVALLAIIAHHHGKLPALRKIFKAGETENLFKFISSKSIIEASPFVSQWLTHTPFDIQNPLARKQWETLSAGAGKHLEKVAKPLDFWLDTQFSFAALIESDKRDASDNKTFRRDELLNWARDGFHGGLKTTLNNLKVEKELDEVRTQIRKEAVVSLREKLQGQERIFTLTAPTGAGKTLTLLELAEEIRRIKGDYAVIYGLPFLSITEQVEAICRGIWKDNRDFVARYDSRAQDPRLDELLRRAEDDLEAAKELAQEDFSSRTFDSAFAITTFVQIFETLLSNRNATLLKLPNFAKTIFLLDEIQALPPRLYLFFAAYLQKFCEKFDCYAVLSTATMPHLELVKQAAVSPKTSPEKLFSDYKAPEELVDFRKFFGEKVFNRYRVEPRGKWNLNQLAEAVNEEQQSTLVILNTIADTRALYKELTENRDLNGAKVILLNTHFILKDRREKIAQTKELQGSETRLILISTQLIEAGVDIDFPVVFRDLCPLPNLIQSAGRCNRNGILANGTIYFFTFVDDKDKPSAEKIYRLPADQSLLRQTTEVFSTAKDESELLDVQRAFFAKIAQNFEIGRHPLWIDGKRDDSANLIEYIGDFNFPIVGSFELIVEDDFGPQFQIYVPDSPSDENWEQLHEIRVEIAKAHDRRAKLSEIRLLTTKLESHLRAMSERIVTVRCRENHLPPRTKRNGVIWEMCGMFKLNFDFDYSSVEGIKLGGEAAAIL